MNEAGKIIMGEDIRQLTEDKLLEYSLKVSQRLAAYPDTMVQFTPNQIFEAMNAGRTILCLDKSGNLLAFGQIWHYGQSSRGQEIKEFGSWLSFKKGGFGVLVLKSARELHLDLYPLSQLVAIVEIENKKTQEIIEDLLKVKSQPTYSKFLKTKNGKPALMKMYDITLS